MQRILQEIMKKNNTWNISPLVNDTIVPSTQRIILKIVEYHDYFMKAVYLPGLRLSFIYRTGAFGMNKIRIKGIKIQSSDRITYFSPT